MYNHAIPFLGIYPEKNSNSKRYMHMYVYIREHYSTIIKEWNNAICRNMDVTRDYHNKWSKSERERQISYDITYMWNLKYEKMNVSMKQKQTHRHREQTCSCQGGGGKGGMEWQFGISRCKLLHTGWINGKVLLCSTGNYVQCPVINHNGKTMKKNIYI